MSNKLTQMARELLQIEEDIIYRFDYSKDSYPKIEDFELRTFEQVWGSTSIGFGGIGGQSITSARTYVFLPQNGVGECHVYFAGCFAYSVPYSEEFLDDVYKERVESVQGATKYKRGKIEG